MSEVQVKVSSVTNAMRGKNILNANSIAAYYKRTARPSANEGCGYSIYIKSQDKDRAFKILSDSGIRIIGVEMQ